MKPRSFIIASIIMIILLFPALSPAAVYVGTGFYIGAGITIGCVTVFFAVGGGEHGYYAQQEEELEHFRELVLAEGDGMRFDATSDRKDIPVEDGMYRVFTW